eukprot:5123037-Prymnesium_polylepis.5
MMGKYADPHRVGGSRRVSRARVPRTGRPWRRIPRVGSHAQGVCIVSQSIAKTAALIRRLVDARLLDDWMALHPQGLYSVLGDKIAARAHKGWVAERCALCDLPERLAQVRNHGFAQVAIATTHPNSWEVVPSK